CVWRGVNNKIIVSKISNKSWVKRYPYLRVLFSYRWLKNIPLLFCEVMRLFNPQNIGALERFYLIRISFNPVKSKLTSVCVTYLGFCYFKPRYSMPFYFVFYQGV